MVPPDHLMEDFNALAAALGAGILDVRGCLILSSDGLVLGAHPVTAEADVRPARIKIAALGDPERGFLQFGTEVWCYVRRGPYAALSVTGTEVRPGLVIDQMEQVLLAAEESRSRRDGLRLDAGTPQPAPSSKPRTPLHPDPRSTEEPVVIRSDRAPTSAASAAPGPPAADPTGAFAPRPAPEVPTTADEPSAGPPGDEPAPPADRPAPERAEPGDAETSEDVDRFSLAREFSRLLQDDRDPADG
jgi:hypothetical protein